MSVSLGEHLDSFVNSQVQSGRFGSANEVLQAALHLLEQEEAKRRNLIEAITEGEKSGIVQNFAPKEFLRTLHAKHVKNGV